MWWGDSCDTMTVVVTVTTAPGEPEDRVSWDSGSNCEPLITDPPRGAAVGSPPPTPQTGGDALATAAACAGATNWIHSSHTLQDPVNIDVAWLRTSAKRTWRCDTTYWSETSGDMSANSGSGPSWWTHDKPTWAVINWRCYPLPSACSQAKMEARAWFHVDFPSCPGGHQDIQIANEVWTNADGTKTFQTSKSATCTGLHSSTGSKITTSKSSGYGGGSDDKYNIAIPNVSGT